jgi:hypothetical protein
MPTQIIALFVVIPWPCRYAGPRFDPVAAWRGLIGPNVDGHFSDVLA